MTPRLRIGVLAFNKHIADEFAAKLRDPRQSIILPGSPEQESIFTAIADPAATRHVIVNALAGSGKSHTLLQSILRFRRRLQAAMVDVQAVTYNSYGWRACLKAFPGVQLDTDKTKRIVAEIVDEHLGLGNLDYTTKGEILGGIRQLTALCKANLLDGTDRTALEDLVEHHGITIGTANTKHVYDLVPRVLLACAADTGTMDYDDQVWQTVTKRLPVEQFDILMVDEAQDLNKMQQEFSLHVCAEGRIVLVGDMNQAIYGFRSADVNSIPNMLARLSQSSRGAVELPLTVTRRCPKSHVRLAQALVPAIQAMDDAPEGVVECASTDKALTEMRPGDLVLCRANAPLVPVCYALIRHGVKAVIRGRDIGTGLLALIDKLIPASNRRIQSVHTLLENLTAYTQREMGKLARLGDRGASKVQALQDRQECLIALTDGVQSIDRLKAKIGVIFADFEADGAPKDAVVLGSVHKTKGLEAGTVWVIAPELLPHPMAKRPWEQVQERNLAYVAATRAKYTIKCDACGGDGNLTTNQQDKLCPKCNGTGRGWDGRLVFVQGAKSGGVPVCYSGKSISAVLHGRAGTGTTRIDKAPVTAIADPREDYERIAAAHAKREVARRYRKETAQGVHNVLHAQEVGEMKRADGERDDLWYGKGQSSPEDTRAAAECACKWRGDKLITSAACPVHGGER